MTRLNHPGTIAALGLMAACQPVTGPTSTPTDPGQTRVAVATLRVVNRTAEAIYFIYISGCDDLSWGSDRLGSEVLGIGRSRDFTLSPWCYDARVETASGRFAEWFGIQASADGLLTLTTTEPDLVADPVAAAMVADRAARAERHLAKPSREILR